MEAPPGELEGATCMNGEAPDCAAIPWQPLHVLALNAASTAGSLTFGAVHANVAEGSVAAPATKEAGSALSPRVRIDVAFPFT